MSCKIINNGICYGRAVKAYYIITKDHAEAYIPMKHKRKRIKGKEKLIQEPILPNIIFVHATKEKIETYINKTTQLNFLKYYYNHFKTNAQGKNPPLTIADDEMENFKRITSTCNEHIITVNPQKCHYKSDDIVKVIDGDFKGVKGRVARISGQQRIVICIESLCCIATAYIPSAFIRKV